MTFTALSYLVWYRTYRRHIKKLIDDNDYADAQTLLESLITEHETNMPNDNSVMHSELQRMKHALKHMVDGTNSSSPPEEKARLTRILLYEPEQDSFEPPPTIDEQ